MQKPNATWKLKLYTPHSAQRAFHSSQARYRVAAWGRQSGKSTACSNELIRRAWNRPGGVYWYVAPTYRLSKTIYRRVKQMLGASGAVRKWSDSELRIEFVQGSVIQFQSGEEYNNLRGETLNGVVIDEVRDQHADLWPLVIRPMLTTTQGWAAFVSTPKGFDSFYDLFEKARTDTSGQWARFHAPSTCSPYFPQHEFEQAKAEMSEGHFAQEILAEFRDIHAGKTYVNFGPENLRDTSPFTSDGRLFSPHLPIVIGMDFNLSPMAWTLGQFNRTHGQWFWADEIWLERSHTQEAAAELVHRLKQYPLGQGVIIAGDATAKAGQRAAAGASDYAIVGQALDAAGIRWTTRTPDSNPPVKDRVNTVNARLKAADGSVKMWIHPTRCLKLKRDLERVSWKQGATGTLDQNTDPTLTHASDGVGYALCALDPIGPTGGVGTVRVIQRTG